MIHRNEEPKQVKTLRRLLYHITDMSKITLVLNVSFDTFSALTEVFHLLSVYLISRFLSADPSSFCLPADAIYSLHFGPFLNSSVIVVPVYLVSVICLFEDPFRGL